MGSAHGLLFEVSFMICRQCGEKQCRKSKTPLHNTSFLEVLLARNKAILIHRYLVCVQRIGVFFLKTGLRDWQVEYESTIICGSVSLLLEIQCSLPN